MERMEEAIKLYIQNKTHLKRFRTLFKVSKGRERFKLNLLLDEKSWEEDWANKLRKGDKPYIRANKALMLLYSQKLLSWDEWVSHPRFLKKEDYERIFTNN